MTFKKNIKVDKTEGGLRIKKKEVEILLDYIPATVYLKNQKNMEMDLYNSEIRFRRLFEASKDGILIHDAETGQIDEVNPLMVE